MSWGPLLVNLAVTAVVVAVLMLAMAAGKAHGAVQGSRVRRLREPDQRVLSLAAAPACIGLGQLDIGEVDGDEKRDIGAKSRWKENGH